MRLARHAKIFSLAGIPMVGNLDSGGVIGLTPEGEALCSELSSHDVLGKTVPDECRALVEHLKAGGYLEGSPEHKPKLVSAYLHVTQRCNLSCRFCYSDDEQRNALPDPSLGELARAIDLLAKLGVSRLVISGGEPFLRLDLASVASHARKRGVSEVVVLTNGLLVDEKNLALLVGVVDCIAVAFDGVSPTSAAHLRGGQRFERLVEAVERIRAAGISARILPTLHAQNIDDMEAYRDLADRLGASLGFSLLTGNICELGALSSTDEQLREMATRARGLALPGTDPFERAGGPLSARRSCEAGVSTLSVAADGTVYPCHMLHDRHLCMGNAFLDTAEKVMGSSVAKTFKSLDAGSFEGCSACDARYLCGGGCRARALLSTGHLEASDPYCKLYRFQYEHIGKRLAQRFGPEGGG